MAKYRKTPEAVSKLNREQYRVTQQSGTEAPGTGEYLDNHEPGIYVDIVSGEPLFASSDKFESGCGWPSFTKPIAPESDNELRDTAHGMVRTEVRPVIDGKLDDAIWATAALIDDLHQTAPVEYAMPDERTASRVTTPMRSSSCTLAAVARWVSVGPSVS